MTDRIPIDADVTGEGQVMIAAAETVAYLRSCADHYGAGKAGGSRLLRKGAQDALNEIADTLQAAYVEVGADVLTDRWWRS